MADAIWAYLQLSRHEGRIFLNKVGFQQKLTLARRLFREHHGRSEFDRATNEIWPMLDRVAGDRNMLVRGRLFMYDRAELISISDRPHASADLSECRVFPTAKLEHLVRLSSHLCRLFEELAGLYGLPGRSPLHPITDRSKDGLERACRAML